MVPETNDKKAKRNSAGDVTAPLQSQAGATNFRYGTGKPDWWKAAQFAESAFWLHAFEETLANIREAAEGWLVVAAEQALAETQVQVAEIEL